MLFLQLLLLIVTTDGRFPLSRKPHDCCVIEIEMPSCNPDTALVAGGYNTKLLVFMIVFFKTKVVGAAVQPAVTKSRCKKKAGTGPAFLNQLLLNNFIA